MTSEIDLSEAIWPQLSDRRVVIAGGTGDVGEGLVRAWLRAGAQVIVPSRTEGTVERFLDAIGDLGRPDRLHFAIGDASGFDETRAMADRIEAEHGPVTDVIASLGGWWQGGPLWGARQKTGNAITSISRLPILPWRIAGPRACRKQAAINWCWAAVPCNPYRALRSSACSRPPC